LNEDLHREAVVVFNAAEDRERDRPWNLAGASLDA
jgi:hypothetical protein